MQNRRKQISVQSLDFDGCLFNMNYIWQKGNKKLIQNNELLLNEIVKKIQNDKADEVILMVGSNRQSQAIDLINFKPGKGTCFPEMEILRAEVQRRVNVPCRIDYYLLADTYGNLPAGESFKKILSAQNDPTRRALLQHAGWVFDDSKLTVLYAQMHRIAMRYPESDILYHFYDDREFDILAGLKRFFSQHSDLIPYNTTAFLYQYDGTATPELLSEIKGDESGGIDCDYELSVKKIARYSRLNRRRFQFDGSYNLMNSIDIEEFKRQRVVTKMPASPDIAESELKETSLKDIQEAKEKESQRCLFQFFSFFSTPVNKNPLMATPTTRFRV